MLESKIAKAADWFIMLRRLAVGVVLDVGLVWLFAWMTKSEWEPEVKLENVATGLLVLWAAQTVLFLKGIIAGWISVGFFETGPLATRFVEVLRASRIRPPGRRYGSRFAYLGEMADSPDEPCNERVRAAVLFASWEAIMQARGLVARYAITKAWDEAVLKYDRERRDWNESANNASDDSYL